jgi:uncharacterized repeat protein (TIGR01451 family)
MKRTLLLLAVAVLCSETSLFAAKIVLSNKDPRSNSELIDREWGARLRNFGVIGDCCEIYIGSGDLSDRDNRKEADMLWDNTVTGQNSFTLEYSPKSPTRIDMTASGKTSASQFYNFQAPVKNPNDPANGVLIDMHSSEGDEEIRITNLTLTIPGGATTNLGTIQVVEKGEVFALITDPAIVDSGFILTGTVTYVEGFQGVSEERPGIQFFGIYDGTATALSDLAITKNHAGNFTQGGTGTYIIRVSNVGTAATTGTVTVADNLPTGLTTQSGGGPGWTCGITEGTPTCTRSDPLAPGASYPPISLTVNVALNTASSVVNSVTVSGGGDGSTSNNTATDATTIITGPDLAITKTASGPFTQGQTDAKYTVTVANTGGRPTSGTVTVIDNLPTGLTLTGISASGWTCSLSGNTGTCTRSDVLAAGASYPPITATVTIAPTAPASVTNTATVSGGGDLNSANNEATVVTPIGRGADLTITKTHTGNFTQGQTGAVYTLTVTNRGAAATTGSVSVNDPMVPSLTPTAASGPGWTCDPVSAVIRCRRSDPLAAGASYPPLTITVSVALDAPASIVNIARVAGGGDTDSSNNSASDPTTIQGGADLRITKSHTGNFTQAQTGTYVVTVDNIGGGPTSGTVTVVDELPAGLIPAMAGGAGWTCNISPRSVSCSRSDALAPGAAYPVINLTVNVQNGAAASVTNTATVSGLEGGSATSNNTATDPTTITPGADLTITKTHTGSFIQGQTGAAYTITVNNAGGTPTSGTVTVSDSLPIGLDPVMAVGSGWTCSRADYTVTCSRSDALAPGQSYPPITLTVNVVANAPASVTNTAGVSGGSDTNSANNTTSDVTAIGAGPNLTLTKTHTGNFTQGQAGAVYTLTVSNAGGGPTTRPVTLIDTLPTGLTATTATGAGWNCTVGGQIVSCSRSDALNPGASYPPVNLTVEVAANAPAMVNNTAHVAGGGDVDPAGNTATDPTTIVMVSDLTIAKTHTGSFVQGQVGATYSLAVMNIGSAPTSAAVSVSDAVPAGLTPTAAAGADWVCNIAAQNVTCTRSDALNAGASYPAITLTVNVAAGAPAALTNTAAVSGGGEVNTANNSATDVTTIGPGPDLTVTKTHTGSFRQGQTGAVYTITGTNRGTAVTSGAVTVSESVPAGLVPTAATGSGWNCNVAGQNLTCGRNDPLASDQSYPAITLTVNVQPDAPVLVTNTVAISGGGDVNSTNNSATDITRITPGPDLTITKTHAGNFTQGQTGATYTVTITNSGVGPTTGPVTVIDILPQGLSATAAAGPGWSCTLGGQAGCTRSDVLAPGASYPPITLTVNVATNAPPSVTNTATVSDGGDGDSSNNTANDVTTIGPGPDLTVTKSHTGNFTQGQMDAAYTVTVTNTGGGPTLGQVVFSDTLLVGLTPTGASGSGWTCTVFREQVRCDRSDALPPGAAYPPITITANVAHDSPPLVSNNPTARISGGGDTNSANNTANDPTIVLSGPDLTITKSHTGNFIQGQNGTYTGIVTNSGMAPTAGLVTVIDILPAGLTAVSAEGPGWNCPGAQASCTRSDPLAPGASYPPITLTLKVAANAPASITNTARVSGGGDVNEANNVGSDPTTITAGPDLTLTKTHTGNFALGQTGATYTLTVSNSAASPTSGAVIVTDTVPTGLVPTAAAGTGWTCAIAGSSFQCERSDALAGGASYPPITLTLNVATTAAASVTNTAEVLGGGDINAANNTASDPTSIVPGPNLTLTKSHTGNFAQKQTGAIYTITAQNTGGSPTSGTVTVIDRVPAGLTATAATGTGWTCTISPSDVTCTRGDALAAGASFPAITLTVDVGTDAPASVTNTATISGGSDSETANNTATDVTAIDSGADLSISKTHTGDFKQGRTGTFTITVTNAGKAPTEGVVALVDLLPAGLTPTTASGAGWTCVVSGRTVDCTRSDPLAPGASYGPVTVTVDVGANAPESVTNRALVVGGKGVNPANNVTSDTANVARGPDLTITKTHPNSFKPGQAGAIFIIAVRNQGGGPTEGDVRVEDDLPPELTATAAQGPGWNCDISDRPIVCSRSDVLAPQASYPSMTLTVNVADVAEGSTITNLAEVFGGGDAVKGNNTAEDSETFIQRSDLSLTKTHDGNFIAGQTGIYTLIVTNTGQEPTTGQVKVEDQVPAGMRPTAASGTGWTCTISGQTVSCTRSDPLASGASYPPIRLVVSVAPDAAASITNTATVSGGGDDGGASTGDVTTIEPAGPYTFAHIAVGGGYLAGLVISNTGSETATGSLIFTDQNGGPFQVSVTESSSTSAQASEPPPLDIVGSSFPYSVPPGGTRILRIAPLSPSDPLRVGWARLVSSTGYLSGFASFEYTPRDVLESTAGVFGGYPINAATIPVDNDLPQGRYTGFAVSNTSNENVNVRLWVLDENGMIIELFAPPELNPLGPGAQASRFLHQYLASQPRFRGSMVLVGERGKKFVAVALVQYQTVLTVTPVVPSKAPQVPD